MSNEKKIIKGLEKLADKHGAEKLAEVIDQIYNRVSTQGDPPSAGCPDGYVWSGSLNRCVPDIG